MYGLNDAPLLWYLEHRDTILSLEGEEKSKLCPALFLFRDPTTKKLIGMIGTHVDDDLLDLGFTTVLRESGDTTSKNALLLKMPHFGRRFLSLW